MEVDVASNENEMIKVEDNQHETEKIEINMNVEINELEENEDEIMKVENNRHEIEEMEEEEMFTEIFSNDSCFESDMKNVTKTIQSFKAGSSVYIVYRYFRKLTLIAHCFRCIDSTNTVNSIISLVG